MPTKYARPASHLDPFVTVNYTTLVRAANMRQKVEIPFFNAVPHFYIQDGLSLSTSAFRSQTSRWANGISMSSSAKRLAIA